MTTLAKATMDIIFEQRKLARLLRDNDAAVDRLEAKVTQLATTRLHAINPQVEFVVCFKSGCHTVDWQPKIYISGVRPSKTSHAMFLRVGDEWVYYAEGHAGTKLYRHKVLTDAPEFDSAALEKAMADLVIELGIPVSATAHEFVGPAAIETPKTIDDLQILHPGCEVLAEGKIWHVGWDISDPWVVIRTTDGVHVYYSTNGHGFGLDTHVPPGGDLKGFITSLVDTNTPVPDVVKGLVS